MKDGRTLELALVAAVLLAGACAWGEEERVMEWRQYPVPYGTPDTKRPPDEEFLKLVPPLKKLGAISDDAKALGVVVWWADYGQLLFSEQPPTDEDLARTSVIRTPAGEDEPAVLALWGLQDLGEATLRANDPVFPVTIRTVEFEPRKIPADYFKYHIEGGRVVGISTYLPERSNVQVKADENVAFWLTVSVPEDARPGNYEIPLRLIFKDAKKVVTLPVTVEVLPFKLPRAKIAYGMYFRPSEKTLKNPRDRTPEKLRFYWRDMARHGMTSATLYNYTRLHDSEGNLKLDAVPVLAWLQEMVEEGLVTPDVPVMFLDGGGFDLANPKAPEILAAFKAEIAKRRWPEFLYYGPDEPAVNEQSLANFRRLEPVRKEFRIVTAISDHAASTYADLLDVWVVNAGRTAPEIQELAERKGAELWNYTCHNRGRGNAPFQRFYAGIYTWALRLKGNFIWAYTENYTREHGQYLPWSPIYCYVVPGDEGVVPSIAWEARREGVEDHRLLTLLEDRIAQRPENDTAREAKTWLEEVRGKVDWFLARKMPPSLYPWDGPELYPLCPDFEPKELAQVRAKAINYCLTLLEGEGG
ncbi:MAG: glycoside hydrolase domain-containing protein [Planctomycetota bacterium]